MENTEDRAFTVELVSSHGLDRSNHIPKPIEYGALTQEQKIRVSRVPLSSADIKALVDTAVNLHSRALEHQKDRRWWVALAGAAGGLVGSVVGALLK